MHRTPFLAAALSAAALVALPAAAQAPAELAPPAEGPLHFTPRPTVPRITPDDLRSRLYAVADDSMMGREAGTLGNVLVTDYLAAEVARLGLRPAGEDGTFFQAVPLRARGPEPGAALTVDCVPAGAGTDFVPVPTYGRFLRFGTEMALRDVRVVYGGRLGDPEGMLAPEAAAGKVVVFSAPVGPGGAPAFQFWAAGTMERYADAAGLAFATLDLTPVGVLRFLGATHVGLPEPAAAGLAAPPVPPALVVSDALAERMMGAPLEGLAVGAEGRAVSGAFRFFDRAPEHPSRNVVAVLPGSDPALRHEYVALGSHSDHEGIASSVVDHDSLRVFNRLLGPKGADQPAPTATPEQEEAVRAELETVRALRPARRDSVYNGADDNASGVVAMLEIAEALAARPVAPRRSVLFVWHTAEEKGLLGAEHFVGDATVPRDSIVAMLNLDMVGRGGADGGSHAEGAEDAEERREAPGSFPGRSEGAPVRAPRPAAARNRSRGRPGTP
jgi:hypothetical protein